ncbi:MAG: response regulator [Anaerolineae bacterium]|nr:response regulator [Anaerolineae bacterium]
MEDSGGKKKILCIDDTPAVRLLVKRLLSHRYAVFEAENGLEGIDMAADLRPDLVFVDLHMPYLNGYEVATRLKTLLPKTPVIALTADISANVRERALASGCDGYLSKPIDPDEFQERAEAFLGGEKEELQDDSYRAEYQGLVTQRLEQKVRELTQALEENTRLSRQNQELLVKSQRRARLLEAAARVSQSITSILDLNALLNATVDIICEEFGFYYAGVFLTDETGEIAVLHAGHGEAGAQLLAQSHGLPLTGASMIGAAIQSRQARIALDVGEEKAHFRNPLLPLTRSEMALPLLVGDAAIGALTVQSTEERAFSEDDITALQTMADQLAIAIKNARLLHDLEEAHAALLRSKTYEAIALATGEAIHWVGNKAAPIPGSVTRIREDLTRYLLAAKVLLESASAELQEHKYGVLLQDAAERLTAQAIDLEAARHALDALSARQLRRALTVDSIFEDLAIIEGSARSILNIKEDLIGPARQRQVQAFPLPEMLRETVASMGIPDDVVEYNFSADVPPVQADRVQLERVFINLIKNAMEAMEGIPVKRLKLTVHRAEEPRMVIADVADAGVGISPEQLDKVWMAFYTTKGNRGGTGLGLPACAQIIGELGGKITVASELGVGTTFSVSLPAIV